MAQHNHSSRGEEREVASQLASLQLMRGSAALLSSRTPDADVAASEIDGSE